MGLGSADQGVVGTADQQQVTPALIGAEPVISPKRTAFNKDFGTTFDKVAYGSLASQGLQSPLGGTSPHASDVSAWPSLSFGFGQGTDNSIWFIFKLSTDTIYTVNLPLVSPD